MIKEQDMETTKTWKIFILTNSILFWHKPFFRPNFDPRQYYGPTPPTPKFPPRHPRNFFDPRQNFMDPRHPRQSLAQAIHEPTYPRYPRHPRYLADSISPYVCVSLSLSLCKWIFLTFHNELCDINSHFVSTFIPWLSEHLFYVILIYSFAYVGGTSMNDLTLILHLCRLNYNVS